MLAAPGLIVETADGLEIHRGNTVADGSRCRPVRASSGYSEGSSRTGRAGSCGCGGSRNGNDILFRTLAPRFQAQLGRRGIVYASGRTLGFTAWVIVSGAVPR